MTSGRSCHGEIREAHVVVAMTGTEDEEETREDEEEEKETEGNGMSVMGSINP